MLEKDLERELRKWREKRTQKSEEEAAKSVKPPAEGSQEPRRTVRVNGQEIVVARKKLRRRR